MEQDSLIIEDGNMDEIETGQSTSPTRLAKRSLAFSVVVVVAVLGVAHFGWASPGAPAVRVQEQEVVQKNADFGELPETTEEKNEFDGVPIYTNTKHGGFGVKGDAITSDWTIAVPETWTTNELKNKLKNLPSGLEVIYTGDPSAGGTPMVIIRGRLAKLKQLLQGHLKGATFVEQDSDVAMMPELRQRRLAVQSWGLDRIDERQSKLDNVYSPSGQGYGAHVYILDTGIRTTHTDFENRAIPTLEVIGNGAKVCSATDTSCASDHDGHGTHCAGTAVGSKYGVAKKAKVHAVKVLGSGGGGSFSWINEALDWIILNGHRPAVASMSLGGRAVIHSTKLTVDRAVDSGVLVVVAAGNEGLTPVPNACEYTPAYVPKAITVGSSTRTDDRSDFSNWGSCIDIFAPGTDIISATHDNPHGHVSFSGTSMACPHVAGGVAILLGDGTPPHGVEIKLKGKATIKEVHDVKPEAGTPNKLLYVAEGGGTTPTTPAPAPPPNGGTSCEVGWQVISGDCRVINNCCLLSPERPADYKDEESCEIKVGNAPGPISVEIFVTESVYDTLTVNGVDYSGEVGPSGVIPVGTITWNSDYSETDKGFRLCLPDLGSPDNGGDEDCTEDLGGGIGSDYRGCQTKTRSGKTCQKWTAQSPHQNTQFTPDKKPNFGLGDHNFCRNPDPNDDTIWCYTTDPDTRWEYCDPLLVEEIDGKKWRPHTGCVKDWSWDEFSVDGYCTTEYHTTAWCSTDKEYDGGWEDCIEVE